jgi:sugar/nucleoside kinase (ribokinase family)
LVPPGLEEGRSLTRQDTPEAIARHYREAGADLVVIKLGPNGAFFDGIDGCGFVAGARASKVIDTIGAGDGFAVGLISALLEGKSVTRAVERAAWIGARRRGAGRHRGPADARDLGRALAVTVGATAPGT